MDDLFKIEGTELTIFVPPELDHYNAEMIRRGADSLLMSRNIRRIVFDFGRTMFMDSAGIGVIMGRYKNIRFMGGEVIAVHVSGRVQRILKLSGIYKIIKIYEESPASGRTV